MKLVEEALIAWAMVSVVQFAVQRAPVINGIAAMLWNPPSA